MRNPWKDICDSAFEPMFDENVSVKTPDGKKTSLSVAVFTDGMDEPISDEMMDTQREDLTFVCRQHDWPFVQTLKRGATITRCANEKVYAISEAKLDNCFGWCIRARQK